MHGFFSEKVCDVNAGRLPHPTGLAHLLPPELFPWRAAFGLGRELDRFLTLRSRVASRWTLHGEHMWVRF